MPRRRSPEKRKILPDPKYKDIIVAKFMNHIMKDGKKIVETANIIKNQTNKRVFLATTAPICSKTKTYLVSKNIQIVTDYSHT